MAKPFIGLYKFIGYLGVTHEICLQYLYIISIPLKVRALSKRLITTNPLTAAAWNSLINLPTPRAITRNWNYGSSL